MMHIRSTNRRVEATLCRADTHWGEATEDPARLPVTAARPPDICERCWSRLLAIRRGEVPEDDEYPPDFVLMH